jgi:hypothetical protein
MALEVAQGNLDARATVWAKVMRETLPRRTPTIIPVEAPDISEGGIKERGFEFSY